MTARGLKWNPQGLLKRCIAYTERFHYNLHDTAVTLNVYQSQDLMQMEKYKDELLFHLLMPPQELSLMKAAVILISLQMILKNNTLLVDFNKAYNPYCAYVSNVYNCPIPPRENRLTVAIRAGEKAYGKPHKNRKF